MLELRFSHQHPGVFQKRIELFARKISARLRRSIASWCDFGTFFDAMQLNGFFTFRDCRFKVTFSQILLLLIGYPENRKQLCIIIFQTFSLRSFSLAIGFRSIIIYVVASDKRLPPSCRCCVATGATSCDDTQKQKIE